MCASGLYSLNVESSSERQGGWLSHNESAESNPRRCTGIQTKRQVEESELSGLHSNILVAILQPNLFRQRQNSSVCE